ncbi:MAG: hypothetical protein CM1200mP36_06240 [Gammaproteobacteria bacterium]|nr:MAG: hypothetical protein CM1200mP36_06240 [Gammaproteobacteria bacterium]
MVGWRTGINAISCACLVMSVAWAQEVQLRASTDRTTVSENESFTYILLMQGRGPVSRIWPRCRESLMSCSDPGIPVFRWPAGRRHSYGVACAANATRGRVIYDSTARASRVSPSNPIQIEVLPAVAADTPGDIFIEVEITPSTAYVQSPSYIHTSAVPRS